MRNRHGESQESGRVGTLSRPLRHSSHSALPKTPVRGSHASALDHPMDTQGLSAQQASCGQANSGSGCDQSRAGKTTYSSKDMEDFPPSMSSIARKPGHGAREPRQEAREPGGCTQKPLPATRKGYSPEGQWRRRGDLNPWSPYEDSTLAGWCTRPDYATSPARSKERTTTIITNCRRGFGPNGASG